MGELTLPNLLIFTLCEIMLWGWRKCHFRPFDQLLPEALLFVRLEIYMKRELNLNFPAIKFTTQLVILENSCSKVLIEFSFQRIKDSLFRELRSRSLSAS